MTSAGTPDPSAIQHIGIDSDLYGEDIRLWSETQSDLLRRLAAGETVADKVDWPHVVEEIEQSHAQNPEQQDEIAQLTAPDQGAPFPARRSVRQTWRHKGRTCRRS
jgi:hypothetical protein